MRGNSSSPEDLRALMESCVMRGHAGDEPIQLDETKLAEVAAALDRRLESETLLIAVQTVLSFATRLDVERRSPRAAFRLSALVEREEVVAALERLAKHSVLEPLELKSFRKATNTTSSSKAVPITHPKKV